MFYKRKRSNERNIHKDLHNEIANNLKIPHMMAFIFGLQKIEISTRNENLKFKSVYYKFFYFVVFLFVSSVMVASISDTLTMNLIKLSIFFKISIPAAYMFLIILYGVVMINSLFFSPKSYKKLIKLLIRINRKFLKVGCPNSICIKKSLIFFFIIQAIAKLANLILTFTGPIQWSAYSFPICSAIVDLELLFLIGYIEIASRSFEILNKKIGSLKKIDTDLKNGIMMKLWNSNDENIEKTFDDNTIETCLSIYNNLFEFLNEVNQCYGSTVFTRVFEKYKSNTFQTLNKVQL